MKPDEPTAKPAPSLDRRALLLGTGAVVAGALGAPLLLNALEPRAQVFLARATRYDGALVAIIRDGLVATGIDPAWVRDKNVLLKPNMVEPSRTAPHMTTHPAVVRATAEVFRGWGAKVSVGEAPGHVRDTEMALVDSGIGEAIIDDKLVFADLNYEEVGWRPNRSKVSPLAGFYFPQAVLEADLVVSLPKLKTHHWVGMTASLKNFYGTLPGIVYGWPKNVLHHAGIAETVVDINYALPRTCAVVDGITCMEGDGPIMGSAKELGVIAIGTNLAAVDATCARLMGFDPTQIHYLHLADRLLGPLAERRIVQRGEAWKGLMKPFKILDKPHLRGIVSGELTS